jgi:hypothetical protein
VTGRKYTLQEIQTLRQYNQQNQNVIFSEKDFAELAAGTARLKVQSHADKALSEIQRKMAQPMARQEIFQLFLTRQEFSKHFGQLHDRLLFLTKTLIKKGVLTEADITLTAHEEIAGSWPHLCEKCKNLYPECKSEKIKFSTDVFSDLQAALADKVVECSGFEQIPAEEVKPIEEVKEVPQEKIQDTAEQSE